MGRSHHGAFHRKAVFERSLKIHQISGGTGITPFCQLLHKELLGQPSANTTTRFTLLHSSRNPNELPPPEMLRPLLAYSQAHPERLKLSFFVDTLDGPAHSLVSSSSATVGRIGRSAIERAARMGSDSWWRRLFGATAKHGSGERRDGKSVMFLVCGPDPYVAHDSGPCL